MSILNIQLLGRRSIYFTELAIFASRAGVMIDLHWLELPMARTIFHGSKGVRAIKVRLYMVFNHTVYNNHLYEFMILIQMQHMKHSCK